MSEWSDFRTSVNPLGPGRSNGFAISDHVRSFFFHALKKLVFFLKSLSNMRDAKQPPDAAKAEDVQHVGERAAGMPATPPQLLSALTATDATIRRLDR